MPYVEVITNVSESLITEEFLKTLGDVVAKTLDRPREKTMVYIKTDKNISMAGDNQPCACVKLLAIERQGVEENKRHSEAIASQLEKIGIPAERAFIFFNDYQPFQVGSQKTTYEAIFKQK